MIQHFIAELQRRKVLRVATGYVVAAWIVLQVAVALQTAWALSASFSGTILNLMIIGFPAAVGLAWFFEITPAGIKRTAASGDGAIAKLQTTDFVLAGALALVFAIGVAQFFWPREAVREVATASEPKTAGTDGEKPKVEPPRLGNKSIAVLPFANLSPEQENEYFADGLTEELVNLLAKIGDIKVISRTSSFAFKGKNTPLPEIAKQLGVRHVVEGSVRAEGDALRVTAQLIDVLTDTHLWSETYERKLEGVFSLQDEIARDIAGALKVEVAISTFDRAAPTKDLVAYRYYLEGLHAYHQRDEAIAGATDLFKKAVERDPKFAEAHAMLAAAYFSQGRIGDPEPAKLARNAATTATKLKPTLGLGYGVLSRLDRSVGDWEAAFNNGRKAISLSPNDSYVRQWFGSLLMMVGQTEAGRTEQLEALRTDPFLDGSKAMVMWAEAIKGNAATARSLAETLLKSPDAVSAGMAHGYLTIRAHDDGDGAKAAEHYLATLRPSDRQRPWAIALANGLRSLSPKNVAIKSLMAASAENPVGALRGLALLGAVDQFVGLLGKASESRHPEFFAATMLFMWDDRAAPIRNDPRWKALAKKSDLVDFWKKHGWPDRCRAKGEDDFECN